MDSSNKPMDNKPAAKPMDDRAGPPRDRAMGSEGANAAADRSDAERDEDQRPVSAAEQRHREEQEYFAREREAQAKRIQEAEALNRQGESAAAMKLWKVYAMDEQAPPFHFSNTNGVMVIAAPSADYARRMAVQDARDDAWSDEEQVGVEEFKPTSPQIIARDFKG